MAKLHFEKHRNDDIENLHNNSENVRHKCSSFSNGRKKWFGRCAIFLAFVICVASVVFSLSGNVASAADAVLWGHQGKDKITTISQGEIARFYDGTTETVPAIYSDSVWGEFVPGGINRVDKAHLPVKRSNLIGGNGVMDSYIQYVSKNVSVVRYSGGTDSNLGISVNGESVGYIKMDVNPTAGRYLYYSISVESLTGSSGSNYGTFAFNLGSSSNIVARSEKNKCGGVANFANINAVSSDSSNWINGYEYGCIDLKALTNNASEMVKTIYIFGAAKSKVVLNYLVMSNTHPTKIDVANGNILYSDNTEGDDTPIGITRTYADVSGKSGTANMTLANTSAFSFENLVVDTDHTPYLYYSFTVSGTNTASISFLESNSTHYVAKKGSDVAITSVTGCIKAEVLLGKEGIVHIANSDVRSKGFIFSSGAKFTVNYLFFCSGVDVSMADHVIVKNADAINVYNANGTFKDYKVTDFVGDGPLAGSNAASHTYKYKVNADSTTGVWAPYEIVISSNMAVDFCWYVNTVESFEGAKKIGNVNATPSGDVTVNIQRNGVLTSLPIEASISKTVEGEEIRTELKIKNPTKKHNGLYFFCLVVSRPSTGAYTFKDTMDSASVNALSSYWNLSSGFCRLDVADNLVYHGVNKNGIEQNILFEDWVVYGTDSKIKNNSLFEANGGYIKYNSYTETASPKKTEFKKDSELICDTAYVIPSYSYGSIESGVSGVNFAGWMFYDETIRNPNGTSTLDQYKSVYTNYFLNARIPYESSQTHKYWTFPALYAFTLDKTVESLVYDTTLNLYTAWEVPVEAENLKVEIFVDEFGTTFMAKQTDDMKYVFAPETADGKNKFINDVIYVAVAPKTNGTSATITAGNGTMQYFIDNASTWIDVDADASAIKTIYTEYTEETQMADAKNWYSSNTEYSNELVYALKMDTDDLLRAFEKSDGISGPNSAFEIKFRYIAGTSEDDGWFNFMGRAVCGTFKFVPFKYHTLT